MRKINDRNFIRNKTLLFHYLGVVEKVKERNIIR